MAGGLAGGRAPETRLGTGLRLARRGFFPVGVVFITRAMVNPIMPLFARRELGASDVEVGLAGAGQGTGASTITIAAGFLVGRFGFTPVISFGVLLCGAAGFLAAVAHAPWQLIFAQFIYGGGWGTLTLAVQFYIRMTVPGEFRGRMMSTLGTTYRLGNLVGPLQGGKMAHDVGFRKVYFLQGGLLLALVPYQAVLGLWTRLRGRRGSSSFSGTGFDPAGPGPAPTRDSYYALLRGSARALLTAGLTALIIQVVRSSRDIILPLKADDLGLTPMDVGSLTSVSYLADLLLSPSSGYLMDRFGRKAAAVPALVIMALGLLIVGLTHDKLGLYMAGAVIGIGNALTSGLVLCMGADLAPQEAVGEFLSLWRILSDGGTAVGPLIVGGLSSAFSLDVSIYACSAVGLLGAAWTVLVVKETYKDGKAGPAGSAGTAGNYQQLSSEEAGEELGSVKGGSRDGNEESGDEDDNVRLLVGGGGA